jgi:hypothetical protein
MRQRTRRTRGLYAAAGLLLAGGLLAMVVGLLGQRHAPQPTAAAANPATIPTATATAPAKPTPTRPPTPHRGDRPVPASRPSARPPVLQLPPAVPTHLDVPAIGVDSVIHPLGQAADGSVQVPPLSRDSWAGWYRHSPTPGQLGPAIILGHVDSAKYGPGVFFRLGALRPRDTITITRADHIDAVFTVQRVVSVPKDHFPTIAVYGPTAVPALRLITCGGRFNVSARSYESNIIAFAVLTAVHH